MVNRDVVNQEVRAEIAYQLVKSPFDSCSVFLG
jgi:hypothetical protein